MKEECVLKDKKLRNGRWQVGRSRFGKRRRGRNETKGGKDKELSREEQEYSMAL